MADTNFFFYYEVECSTAFLKWVKWGRETDNGKHLKDERFTTALLDCGNKLRDFQRAIRVLHEGAVYEDAIFDCTLSICETLQRKFVTLEKIANK